MDHKVHVAHDKDLNPGDAQLTCASRGHVRWLESTICGVNVLLIYVSDDYMFRKLDVMINFK